MQSVGLFPWGDYVEYFTDGGTRLLFRYFQSRRFRNVFFLVWKSVDFFLCGWWPSKTVVLFDVEASIA